MSRPGGPQASAVEQDDNVPNCVKKAREKKKVRLGDKLLLFVIFSPNRTQVPRDIAALAHASSLTLVIEPPVRLEMMFSSRERASRST